jgi:hypothetical protein
MAEESNTYKIAWYCLLMIGLIILALAANNTWFV